MSAPIPIPRERLQKAMYRAVDLIEAFFPHPEIPTQITTLGQAQKDFIDCIQFGFPTSQYTFGEIQPSKGVITIWRRQVSKSWSCAYATAALMILYPRCRIGIIAASEEQSQILIDKVKYIFDNSQFSTYVDGRPKLTLLKLRNKSECRSHPASERSIRGYAYDWVIIDESALMDDSFLLAAVLPTVTHGRRWVAISTPRGRKGKLIEYYYKALESRKVICKNCRHEYDQKEFPLLQFPNGKMPNVPACRECEATDYKYGMGIFATPYLDPWECNLINPDDLQRELDLHDWSPWARQELLGEIIDEASMVILQEWITRQYDLTLRNIMEYNPNYSYILGLDYGRQHDATSFCVTHRGEDGLAVVDYMKTVSGEYDIDTDYSQIREHVREIVQFYRPRWIVPDATGLGNPLVEALKTDLRRWGVAGNCRIYNENRGRQLGFIFSKQSKQELIGNLIRMLSDTRPQIRIPPPTEPEIGELQTELLRFECEVMEGGYIKYGTQEYHDDRVIALALSLWMHRRGAGIPFVAEIFDYGESRTTREAMGGVQYPMTLMENIGEIEYEGI